MSMGLRSRFLKKLLPLGLLLLLTVPAIAEEPPTKHIQDVLSPEEFHRAGLEKLSESELEYLSGLIYGREASQPIVAQQPESPVSERKSTSEPKPEKTVSSENQFGAENIVPAKKDEPKIPNSIQSSIAGKFTGWSGGTVFELENGQVWKQISRDRFKVNLTDPKVEVFKSSFGTYFLKVEGYGSRCKVKRIK